MYLGDYENYRFVIYRYSTKTKQYSFCCGCDDPKDAFNKARLTGKSMDDCIDEYGIEFTPDEVRVYEIPMEKVVAIYNESGMVKIDYNIGRKKKPPWHD